MKAPTNTCRPLPPFFASAIDSIRWPLAPADHPPLHFRSLEELEALPRTNRLDPAHPLATKQLRKTLDELFGNDDDESAHFGYIATALVVLGHGLVDEAHSLVTPFSWPDEIHFNHGPVRYHKVSPSIRTYATYTHCLVHRYETDHIGEFGMTGWANANFWGNAVMNSPGLDTLPHEALFERLSGLVDATQDLTFRIGPRNMV